LECLEGRLVPTIQYNPVFGPEATIQDGSEHMQQPQVYLIFWGAYWSYSVGPSQAASLANTASQVVNSTFPLITNQYGADASGMSIAGTVFDYSIPSSGNFGAGDINDVVTNQIDQGALPESDAFNGNDHSKIYVVITAPTVVSSDPQAVGFNHVGTDTDVTLSGVDVDDIGECWVWSGNNQHGFVDFDSFSLAFSHEVAEIMSDFDGEGYEVNPPPGAPPGSGNQIGDYEGNSYAFRLSNGVDVQPVWSRADNAWAVNDGTNQKFYLDAAGNWAGTQFNGQYALTLNGDQNGSPTDDTVTISQGQNGGVQVTQNGETVNFDKNMITGITVNMKDGNDTINVEQVISGVPITINLGGGSDVVNISPSAGDLKTIQDNVTVNAGSGFDSLNIDDQNNFDDATWTMNAGSLTRTNAGTIFYNGLINSLKVNGGRGNVAYDVNGTQPFYPTTVNTGDNNSAQFFIEGTTGPFTANLGSGLETVLISPSARNLDNILGNVTINGLFGVNQTPLNSLIVTDQNNGNFSHWAIEGSNLVRNDGISSTLIHYQDIGDLELHGGFGGSSFNVTPIGQNLDTLPATFNITGGKSSDSLILNDQANSLFASWSITGANVTRTSAGLFFLVDTVNYSHIGNLTVNGGSGGSEFDLSPTARNLDELPANVTVNGGGSSDAAVLDDQNNPNFSTWNVDGTSVDRSYTLFVVFQNHIIPVALTTRIHYSQLSNLVLNGGSGGSEFDLSPFAQDLDELPATVTVNGGGSTNNLNVFDQGNSNSSTWNIGGTSLDRTWLASNFIHILPITRTIDYSALTSLALHGGGDAVSGAGNTFNISGTPASTSVDSGVGNDQVNVQASANPLSVNGDLGTDTVTLGSKAPSLSGTLSLIAGPVSVSNHSMFGGSYLTGQTTLIVDDSGDGSSKTPTLTGSSLAGLGPVINYTSGEVTNLQVLGGMDGNNFNVQSTGAGTSTTLDTGIGNDAVNVLATTGSLAIDGQAGTDTVTIGSNAPALKGVLANIMGPVSVANSTGQTALIVDDSGDATGQKATVTNSSISGTWSAGTIHYTGGQVSSLTILGGGGGNTFTIVSTGSQTLNLSSGTGNDVVNVQAISGPLNLNGQAGSDMVTLGSLAPAIGGVLNNLKGAIMISNPSGATALAIDDSGDATTRTATITKSSTAGLSPFAINYANLSSLTINGGSGGLNTYDVQSTAAGTPVILNAGSGSNDAVIVGSGGSTSTLDAIQGGLTVNSQTSLTALQINDMGSMAGHSYTVTVNTLSRSGTALITYDPVTSLMIRAGSGDDALAVVSTASGTPVTFDGGGGANTLIGPNLPSTFDITSNNAGTVGNVTFSSVQNLVGGSAADTFKFHTGAGVSGTINGGGGTNTLDYTPYKGDIKVNLPLGTATAVAGGIKNIQNVMGGQGNSLIVGDANPNVLIGGTGRNVLIGGGGADTLDVSGATSDNILIGGTTDFDTNQAALNAIFAEWTRTDLGFRDRFSDLTNGSNGALNVANNQLILLNPNTVHADLSPDTLIGGTKTDPTTGLRLHNWFFFDINDVIVNFLSSSDHKTKTF
jgi:acrosin